MRALLVYPRFPRTYWGQEYTHAITGKRAVLPPLGLLTVAALCPAHWRLRLVDLNVEPLSDADLAWSDVVLLSAMRVQQESFHEVVRRAHAAGKRVVAGGPYVTTDPEAAPEVDHLVLGEAEDLLPGFLAALEAGDAPARVGPAAARPDPAKSPPPRFDLLKVQHYTAVGVQFSRGCPFNCEFCDIIEIFGRVPRTKSPEQFVAELDAVRATGYRGAVFVVDDNFIGNKVAAKRMLGALGTWSRTHAFPFDFFTEASVNLAGEDALVAALVAAGFSAVFLGIETPSREALAETHKRQNLHLELDRAVEKLVSSGLNVMAGFIVGFDADDAQIFERQHEFISRSPIAMAMVGMLTALPGTQLWRRLKAEGRLRHVSEGGNQGRSNFVTRLPEDELVAGYERLLARLYEPRAYFGRALRSLELQRGAKASPYRRPLGFAARALALSIWKQGVRGSYRAEYWRFLAQAALLGRQSFARGMAFAIAGEHMIRFTAEDVLPALACTGGPRESAVEEATASAAATTSRRAARAAASRGSAWPAPPPAPSSLPPRAQPTAS
ncbi:MAG: B12-binding domain-containing radical SAM protein [Deltaproteobacteria bacterium]|nr:B12-binding domain-containing radical SAM protein [Deltaproteobacteria bacterium]